MGPTKTTLIDSITIPLSRLTSGGIPPEAVHPPEPEAVQICCPPSGSTLGTDFTASGSVDGVDDTALTDCYITPPGGAPHHADVIPPPMTGTNWTASFTNVAVGNGQTLTAVGNHLPTHGTDSATNLDVVAGPVGACTCVTVTEKKAGDGSKELVHAITFQGKFPVDAYGKPKPLSLSFTGPATFSVGGPVIPPNRVIKCTLGHQVSEPLMLGGDRWTARFSNVPAGKHTLRVVAEDGTTDDHQIEISTTPRATEGGRASQEVAVS